MALAAIVPPDPSVLSPGAGNKEEANKVLEAGKERAKEPEERYVESDGSEGQRGLAAVRRQDDGGGAAISVSRFEHGSRLLHSIWSGPSAGRSRLPVSRAPEPGCAQSTRIPRPSVNPSLRWAATELRLPSFGGLRCQRRAVSQRRAARMDGQRNASGEEDAHEAHHAHHDRPPMMARADFRPAPRASGRSDW